MRNAGTGPRTLICLGVLLLYAVAALPASLIPYEWLNSLVRPFSGSGDMNAFSPATYADIQTRCRFLTIALLVVWVAAFLGRRKLATWTELAFAGTRPAALRERTLPEPLVQRGFVACAVAVVALTVLGAGLRIMWLDQPMRHDESTTFMLYARMPFVAIPLRYSDPNNQILHTLLVKLAVSLFGDSPSALRLPALIAGIALVPLAAGFARALQGNGAMVITAALVATSSPLIEFSNNARGYTLLCCCTVVLFWAGLQATRTNSRAAWVTFILAGAIGAYTHPGMATPAVAGALWTALLLLRRDRGWRADGLLPLAVSLVAMGVLVAMLYLPILVVNGWHALTDNSGVHATATISASLERLGPYASGVLSVWLRDDPSWAWMVVAAAIVAAMALASDAVAIRLLVVAAIGSLVWHVLFVHDLSWFRFWLPYLALLLVVTAVGLDAVLARIPWQPRLVPAAPSILLAVLVGGWTAESVIQRRTVLSSGETLLYPEAATVGRAISTARRGDYLEVPSIVMDEILYYSYRNGVRWSPVGRLGSRFLLRCIAAPNDDASQPQALYVVFTSDEPHGSAQDAVANLPGSGISATGVQPVYASDTTTVDRVSLSR